MSLDFERSRSDSFIASGGVSLPATPRELTQLLRVVRRRQRRDARLARRIENRLKELRFLVFGGWFSGCWPDRLPGVRIRHPEPSER